MGATGAGGGEGRDNPARTPHGLGDPISDRSSAMISSRSTHPEQSTERRLASASSSRTPQLSSAMPGACTSCWRSPPAAATALAASAAAASTDGAVSADASASGAVTGIASDAAGAAAALSGACAASGAADEPRLIGRPVRLSHSAVGGVGRRAERSASARVSSNSASSARKSSMD